MKLKILLVFAGLLSPFVLSAQENPAVSTQTAVTVSSAAAFPEPKVIQPNKLPPSAFSEPVIAPGQTAPVPAPASAYVSPSTGTAAEAAPYATASETNPARSKESIQSPVALSGMILMPTAYRGTGKNTLGLGLDFNAAYYIGRIYGENNYNWTLRKTNYIDRVGVWLIGADAKMLVQTESKWRPALAFGVQGFFALRDAPQPSLNTPSVSISVNSTNKFASAYGVISKRPFEKLILSAGMMEGDIANQFPMLSEFLSPEALKLSGHPDASATSKDILFAGFMFLLKPAYPVGMEIIIPQGATMHPKLINLHLGALLKLNFELSILTFEGGWDLLGMFQFRYPFFPK